MIGQSNKQTDKQRLQLYICRINIPPPPSISPIFMSTGSRLLVMSMRAQSLLNLKMYKLKKHELKELQKTISDVLSKSDKDEDNQQV